MLKYKPDFIFTECVDGHPTAEFLAPNFEEHYVIWTGKVCPYKLGYPYKRSRKMGWLIS